MTVGYHIEILIFIDNSSIVSQIKRYNTVELATFGSDFFAMMIAGYFTVAMIIKIKMFEL